ncbi:MAG: outer membrane lipoprotein carrier protein LolA [Myxococcales bacterium]|nr:outer membrane lipoprotein carrier protein LolA [Polyangiaceae bacterium]MDW8248160.1 outer membrane lipoprotein carrier protein LolA [Myxococcales bacterium]
MRRRALLVLLPAIAWTPPAGAEEDIARLLHDVARAREKLRSLSSTFTQERVLDLLATTVTSKGELTLVRPDRLRWELSPPDEIIYWVTPEGIAYRTPRGSGKVDLATAGTLAAILGDLMILLGGDLGKLRDRYTFAVDRPGTGPTLRLTPKDERVGKLIRRITVLLPANLLFPRRIVLEEPSGDSTTIAFDPPRINPPVDPARMRPS